MENQVVVKVGLWSLDGTQSTVQSIVQFTSQVNSPESTTLENPSDNSVLNSWGSGMWFLHWSQASDHEVYTYTKPALCLCGKLRIPKKTFNTLYFLVKNSTLTFFCIRQIIWKKILWDSSIHLEINGSDYDFFHNADTSQWWLPPCCVLLSYRKTIMKLKDMSSISDVCHAVCENCTIIHGFLQLQLHWGTNMVGELHSYR